MKKRILGLLFILLSAAGFAQQKEYQLSTHILDISEGIPAENVKIKLEKMNAKTVNGNIFLLRELWKTVV